MSTNSIRRHRERNRGLPCSVSGCPKRRHGSSRYCASHAKRRKNHGHPLGRHITTRELKPYARLARDFLSKHKDTPQVEAAHRFFQDFLTLGNPEGSDAEKELHRLHIHGLTPDEALHAVLPVWLLSMTDPRALPNDERLTYAMALALLKSRTVFNQRVPHSTNRNYRRRYFAPTGTARREVGEVIRGRLGMFFSNVVAELREQWRRDQEQVQALATRFTTTTRN